MSATAGTPPPAEWFLARDGQQFGPLSDPELRKLVEFGHLKPTDLLWREGFPDWRPARILLPDGAGSAVTIGVASLENNPMGAPSQAEASSASEPTQTSPSRAPVAETKPAAETKPVTDHTPVAATAPVAAQKAAIAQPTQRPHERATQHERAPERTVQQPAPQQVAPGPRPEVQPRQQANQPQAAPLQPHRTFQLDQMPSQWAQAPSTQPSRTNPASSPTSPSQAYRQGSSLQGSNLGVGGQRHGVPGQPGFTATHNPGHQGSQGPLSPRPFDLPRPTPAAPVVPVATAARPVSAAPVHRPRAADYDDDDDADDDGPHQGSRTVLWIKRVAVLTFFTSSLSAAVWYAYPYRDQIISMATAVTSMNSSASTSSPIVGFQPNVAATDAALQKAPLWRTLKKDFPEWYGERIAEASALAGQQKAEAEIGLEMMKAVMALRRKHAGDALAATTPRLKAVASAFADNLIRLRQVSVDTCHGFISSGETSPGYLKLLADSSHSGALQAQLTAVFDAIADGRKLPRIYPQPKQTDYNLLVTALESRGWTDADMQLFSDSRKFGQAAPEKVCQMVTDWFQSQLDLKDPDAQLRLLADALKPVVAG